MIADDFILVIEVKLTGNWRRVAEAAWQLFQARTLLAQNHRTITTLGVFGRSCQDPILMEMLRRLSIESIWSPWSRMRHQTGFSTEMTPIPAG
ncbi:hypothetical protein [Kozakia baliensis]|uniref:hypothetical protein n=1 Tax=Kozakia baliensis TaxID=153496 RepID=UPI0011E02FF7|nr:hypothetical protein [Kozakia baliensis]